MKKLLTVFFFTFSLSSYGQITFQKSFTTGVGYCVHQTIDSGYIVIGTIYPAGAGNTIDVSLIKTNQYGDTLWTRTF